MKKMERLSACVTMLSKLGDDLTESAKALQEIAERMELCAEQATLYRISHYLDGGASTVYITSGILEEDAQGK